jgi:DNA-directed RNA polymerase specialized sigma24 family protein
MALAHAIAEHLPYLRRYARALAGTQQSGDAYVRACLEAIVADTSILGDDASPRVALYRLFHRLWDTTNLDARPAAGAGPVAADNVE